MGHTCLTVNWSSVELSHAALFALPGPVLSLKLTFYSKVFCVGFPKAPVIFVAAFKVWRRKTFWKINLDQTVAVNKNNWSAVALHDKWCCQMFNEFFNIWHYHHFVCNTESFYHFHFIRWQKRTLDKTNPIQLLHVNQEVWDLPICISGATVHVRLISHGCVFSVWPVISISWSLTWVGSFCVLYTHVLHFLYQIL